MKARPDMLDSKASPNLEVFQLTDEPLPSATIYMEAQIFTPDSKRLVLHRSAGTHGQAHGSQKNDPNHQYLLCDFENNGALTPLTCELGVTAPSVCPKGRYLYYLVDRSDPGDNGHIELKRVQLDGTRRETLVVIDSPLPETSNIPSHIYVLSTISSDGRRLAAACFLGDGRAENASFGLLVFDLEAGSVEVVLQGPTFSNLHPQYCRSLNPTSCRDMLVQENHGYFTNGDGQSQGAPEDPDPDIHFIRDDGTALRDMPWGRNGQEICQGHQCWIGRSTTAITSTWVRDPKEGRLVAGGTIPHTEDATSHTPAAMRNDLTPDFPNPHFVHFATDLAGNRLVSDFIHSQQGWQIYMAEVPGDPLTQPLSSITYLMNPRCRSRRTHPHPFLSPDGSMCFFNSDESGMLQAYMARVQPT